MDERTKIKGSDFYETKDGMVEPTCELFEKWQKQGKPVKFVRMDSAGKNIKLENGAKERIGSSTSNLSSQRVTRLNRTIWQNWDLQF